MKNGVPRILIIRLSAIGDVVRVLPALHTLREAYPNAQIDWAVERKSAGIVEGHPSLDDTLVFERPEGFRPAAREFLAFCRKIRQNKYDIVMDFHGIFKTGIIMAWSGAQERYGFARPRARELSWLSSTNRVKLPSSNLNRVKENLLLCSALKPGHEITDVTIFVPVDIQDEVNVFFDQMFEGGKIVVALHTPVEREEKQWPAERYAELADLLAADGRFEVMLTWGPGQFEQVEKVLARTRRNPVVAPETADIKQYAWLVHRAGLYVGGDTGPMHIAAAMGTPVVAIFGGTDPAKHAPYKRPSKVLYPEGDMTPKERLDKITPEMVYDACISLVIDK
jgi:lipopolysaccharide heptosyltransferase I